MKRITYCTECYHTISEGEVIDAVAASLVSYSDRFEIVDGVLFAESCHEKCFDDMIREGTPCS